MDPSEQLLAFQEILDAASLRRVVDLKVLRSFCSRGIPHHPPWIRPRIWKLLLGTLPPEKDRWTKETNQARDSYYAIAAKFLGELQQLPEPQFPLTQHDKLIDSIAKDVDRTQPRDQFFKSQIEPNPLSPLHSLPRGFSAEEHGGGPIPDRIEGADGLFQRLERVREAYHSSKRQNKGPTLSPSPAVQLSTPEIRLSPSMAEEPKRTLPAPTPTPSGLSSSNAPMMTPMLSVTSADEGDSSVALVESQEIPNPIPKHSQILLRILYLFSMIHPHQPYTQGLNELLAPLYRALYEELDDNELAHVEADAFWLFSHLISEVGSVVGEPGDWDKLPPVNSVGLPLDSVKSAMLEFSNRLKWADIQLWEDLTRKSLNPALPYYSYRWIACLLAQDLPLGAVFKLWDAIFSQPPASPDDNPRLSFLLDICTSMLIRLRARLINTGNSSSYSGGLWGEEYIDADAVNPDGVSSLDGQGTMGEGFIEGMKLLQAYPLKTIGLTPIIEGAWDLTNRRKREEEQRARGPGAIAVVSSRLREQIWGGATSQVEQGSARSNSGDSEDDAEAGRETIRQLDKAAADQTPSINAKRTSGGALPALRQYAVSLKDSDAAASLAKASTNWTVAAKEALGSKPAAHHEQVPPSPPPAQTSPPPTSKLMQYAEAIRSSDAAASISKVSSNWTAAALDRWTSKPAYSSPLNPSTPLPGEHTAPADNRGSGFGKWAGLWGGGSPSSSQGQFSPKQTPSEWNSPGRDVRNSLPVPLHPSVDRNRSNSPGQRRGSSPPKPSNYGSFSNPGSESYSPPPMPKHFAAPRDYVGDDPRDRHNGSSGYGSPSESPPEDSGAGIGRTISSALASLSGAPTQPPEVPSPSQTPKRAPKPLLLGTAKIHNPNPSFGSNRQRSDSRDSSVSSIASPRSVSSTTNTTNNSSVRYSGFVNDMASPKSDPERPIAPGFVPLCGVGIARSSGSTTIMRKSRAAYAQTNRTASPGLADDSGPGSPASSAASPLATAPPPVNGSQFSHVDEHGMMIDPSVRRSSPMPMEPIPEQKYALADRPPLSIQTLKSEEASDPAGNPLRRDRSKIRAKRQYTTRSSTLTTPIAEVMSPHYPGIHEGIPPVPPLPGAQLQPPLHMEDGDHQDGPVTPRVSTYDQGGKTPTSAESSLSSPAAPRGPRSPRSPRRNKKPTLPKEERVRSGVFSEEEGARADDEDGYGDLLNAYSEDDNHHHH